jgi:hypothetical protein
MMSVGHLLDIVLDHRLSTGDLGVDMRRPLRAVVDPEAQ